jgi:hypothetical protein
MPGEAARTRRHRRWIATLLSRSIAIPIVAFACAARAEEPPPPPGSEVAQPAPAYPPPPAVWPAPAWPPTDEALTSLPPAPPPPPRRAPTPFVRRRHYLGAQLGGSGLLQVVYRYRAVGPLHLEVGGLGTDHAGNASLGLLVAIPFSNRMFPYAGLGGGWAAAFGPKSPDFCSSPMPSACPTGEGSDTLLFVHVRVGIGFALGRSQRQALSFDAGAWIGTELSSRTDALGMQSHWAAPLRLPMVGMSYLLAL